MNLVNFLLIILSLIPIVVHTVILIKRKKFFLFDPLNIFWIGILITLIYQGLSYGNVLIIWNSDRIFNITYIYLTLALIFIIFGYELKLPTKLAKGFYTPPIKLNYNRLTLVSILFMIIGLLGYYFMAESSGGVERWLSVPRGDTDYNVVSGYHALAIEFLHLGTVLFFLVFNLRKSRLGLLILSSIPITINLLWYLYLGSRSRTIALFLSFLLCIYLPKQKNPSFKFIIP